MIGEHESVQRVRKDLKIVDQNQIYIQRYVCKGEQQARLQEGQHRLISNPLRGSSIRASTDASHPGRAMLPSVVSSMSKLISETNLSSLSAGLEKVKQERAQGGCLGTESR